MRNHLLVFSILNITKKKLLNFCVKGCQSLALLEVREVDRHVSPGGDDVELWIKDVNPMNHSV